MYRPGFKTERVVTTTFQQEFLNRLEDGKYTPVGKGSMMRLVEDVATDFDPSMLSETNSPFDFAIYGQGYFNVVVDGKRMLTRNGRFELDEEGYLILPGAGRVQGENGDVKLENDRFIVTESGQIYNEKGKLVDTLVISQPSENVQLEKFTRGLYSVTDEQFANGDIVPATESKVLQGVIEKSNVEINRELTMIIETQRNFQSCNNALKTIDQMNAKTASIAQL